MKVLTVFILIAFLSLMGCQTTVQSNCIKLQKVSGFYIEGYQAVINKKVIQGIDNNLSGLTWNPDTQTLFGILNKPATIVELSTQGELLRKITLLGIYDPEAIEYIASNQFIIADERNHRLIQFTLNQQAQPISIQMTPQLTLKKIFQYNKGLEGVAYNRQNKIIYLSNESNPIAVYKIKGFIDNQPATVNEVKIDWPYYLKDISGLHFDSSTQTLLVLSDESKLVLTIDSQEKITGCAPLFTEVKTIRQPEGITMDDKGNLYIISEPNFFYKYNKK